MTEEENRCKKCGYVNDKGDNYCMKCGVSLKTLEFVPKVEVKVNDNSKIARYKRLTPISKLGLYFGIVLIVNLVTSLVMMLALGLSLETYSFLFLGFFLLSMIITGIIMSIAVNSDFHNFLGKAIGYTILGLFVILLIVIPIYILAAFPAMLNSLSISISLPPALQEAIDATVNRINETVGNAIYGFFKVIFSPFTEMAKSISESIDESLENVEVPGFEPFLLGTIFMIASILIIHRYHLKTRKAQIHYERAGKRKK